MLRTDDRTNVLQASRMSIRERYALDIEKIHFVPKTKSKCCKKNFHANLPTIWGSCMIFVLLSRQFVTRDAVDGAVDGEMKMA